MYMLQIMNPEFQDLILQADHDANKLYALFRRPSLRHTIPKFDLLITLAWQLVAYPLQTYRCARGHTGALQV